MITSEKTSAEIIKAEDFETATSIKDFAALVARCQQQMKDLKDLVQFGTDKIKEHADNGEDFEKGWIEVDDLQFKIKPEDKFGYKHAGDPVYDKHCDAKRHLEREIRAREKFLSNLEEPVTVNSIIVAPLEAEVIYKVELKR